LGLAKIGLAASFPGVVMSHIILGTPFVVITVTATLSGFDDSITRAASSLGSPPTNTFFKITLPLILPGIISGALFAFVTSFDEIVVILFVAGGERSLTTIPLQMWTGLTRTTKSYNYGSSNMFNCYVYFNISNNRTFKTSFRAYKRNYTTISLYY
jgi:ABC-type spermidine/putrescine transport system permease subunit II